MSLLLALFKHPHIQSVLKFHGIAQRNNEIMKTASRRNELINTMVNLLRDHCNGLREEGKQPKTKPNSGHIISAPIFIGKTFYFMR
ncbi:hypothetical protein K501DRAFT_307274 [Backusella circina FSU 941]|nr:hypothetical protein K501DRAFT_307274 [Backusella circina FSU 941]